MTDKRLLVLEAEVPSTLRGLERDGNPLSAILRKAWDDGNLKCLTKNSPANHRCPYFPRRAYHPK
jgi:hypothetical protein